MLPVKSCSLAKNLIPLTSAPPKPIITWDRHERIRRNKEIWDDPSSIVHRLPLHYQRRYWKDFVLAKHVPVHYTPPEFRFFWDSKRNVELETEEYPVLPEHCPEQDQGLWGGEGVVKGFRESNAKTTKKILPRHWVPRLWFPTLRTELFYSEILDLYMKIVVTPRVLRLIDQHYGLDFYLLDTPEVDINSKLGIALKRQLLVCLAKQDYFPNDEARHSYIKEKYSKFLMPLEEAEWFGLDLNAACRKLQDIEDNLAPTPMKQIFEEELLSELKKDDVPAVKEEEGEIEEVDYEQKETHYPKNKWIGWRI